jgi:hypothetical protein
MGVKRKAGGVGCLINRGGRGVWLTLSMLGFAWGLWPLVGQQGWWKG